MNALNILSLIQKAVVVAPEKKNVGTKDRIASSAAGLLLAYTGLKTFKKGGFALLLPAGYLIYRGTSGYCYMYEKAGIDTTEGAKPFNFTKTITIQKSKDEVYRFWRQLENLPQIMTHVSKVEKLAENKYMWEAEFNKQHFRWNALIIEDIPGKKISWTSVDSPDVENSGKVEFNDAPKGGMELKVTICYKPAKTAADKLLAHAFDPVFKQRILDNLRQFKRKVETGEIIVNKMKK